MQHAGAASNISTQMEWQSNVQPAKGEFFARTGVSLTQSTASVREEVLVSFETVWLAE